MKMCSVSSLRLKFQRQALFLAAIGATALLGACATNKNLQPASATPTSHEGGFDLADANHDGYLSRDEASDFLSNQIFDATDTNHDGVITKDEATASHAKGALAEFKKMDRNHDGKVTRAEALAYNRKHGLVNKLMREADKNHDGKLSKAEVEAYYKSRESAPY